MVNSASYPGFTHGGLELGDHATDNLSNIHGSVHLNTGGRPSRGNMTDTQGAAFDPIFFLWHW